MTLQNIGRTALVAMTTALLAAIPAIASNTVIEIKPAKGDMTRTLQKAIDRAEAKCRKGDNVEIRLLPGVYNISRAQATPILYHVSNTTSVHENPDPTKHVGLLIRNADGLTISGAGTTLLTHGEMTPWVIDNCRNVTLRDITIDAADPSVPEMTVISTADSSFTAMPHATSHYRITPEGKLYWTGEGWEFTDGIAQVYDPDMVTTLRCGSPVVDCARAEALPDGSVRFIYSRPLPREIRRGVTFQMRHSFRTEVAGFINRSEKVELDGLNLNFMGNFGVVAQYSTDITYNKVTCAPAKESGRTCAGFADFFQVSGCRGDVNITGCYFAGAHDDPINVHGTHLEVVEQPAPDRLVVRFRHNQTFGFEAFFAGDEVALVNANTLLAVDNASALHIESACLINDYDMELVLNRPVTLPATTDNAKFVVENLTWTPTVRIADNTFTLTPTRGILVTTCRPVTIENNTFVGIPMASILVADDARSWYESGPVRDLTIRNNVFSNCSAPQILVAPEVKGHDNELPAVHSDIRIIDNRFTANPNGPFASHPFQIKARSVDGLRIEGNRPQRNMPSSLVLDNCTNVVVK